MSLHDHSFAGTVSIPPAHLEEAVALLSHDDARTYRLELTMPGSTMFGARIFPPERQHLQAVHPLFGSFYGCGMTPREAVQQACACWTEHKDGCARSIAREDTYHAV